MRVVPWVIGSYLAIFAVAFMVYGVPQPYSIKQAKNAERPITVIVRDVGPYKHYGKVVSPAYETLCIRATGECRTVQEPYLHQKLVTFCNDPRFPGGVIFYNKYDGYCGA